MSLSTYSIIKEFVMQNKNILPFVRVLFEALILNNDMGLPLILPSLYSALLCLDFNDSIFCFCGEENEKFSQFCKNCGYPLANYGKLNDLSILCTCSFVTVPVI